MNAPEINTLWRRVTLPDAHYVVDDIKNDEVLYRATINEHTILKMPIREWYDTMEELFDDDFEIY